MATLIVLIFVAAAVGAVGLVISNLSDMQASKLDTAGLRPEISAAIQNADLSQMTALCARYPESPIGRVVRSVIAESDRLPADEMTRSELLRMLLDQGLATETERASRGPSLLRTIGFACIPLGLMATVWNIWPAMASAGWLDSPHQVPSYTTMARAVPYTIGGLILSLAVLVLYKYLKARTSAALSELDDSCSDLLAAFLSRPGGKCP
jgi:biopolymer transport protein ExbB/TolQ